MFRPALSMPMGMEKHARLLSAKGLPPRRRLRAGRAPGIAFRGLLAGTALACGPAAAAEPAAASLLNWGVGPLGLSALVGLALLGACGRLATRWSARATRRPAALRDGERLAEILRGTGEGSWEWNALTGEARFNERWADMVGYRLEELEPVGIDTWRRLAHPDDLAESDRRLAEHFSGNSRYYECECRMRHRDGRWIWVLDRGRVVEWQADGKPLRLAGTHTDITERKNAELALQHRETHLRAVLDSMDEGVVVHGPDGAIRSCNLAAEAILGLTRQQLLDGDRRWEAVREDGSDFPSDQHPAMVTLRTGGAQRGVVMGIRRPDTGLAWLRLTSVPLPQMDDGDGQGVLVTFADISRLKEQASELQRLAHFDALTGLPNRRLLADRLHRAVSQAARNGWLMAVAYMDLDGFKQVNDSLGHNAGDRLLQTLAGRLQSSLRVGDTVARLGGDEFVLVLTALERLDDCIEMLGRIQQAVAKPVLLGGTRVGVTASIGVTVYPHDSDDPEVLLRHADQAMYRAKEGGKRTWHLFDFDGDRRMRSTRDACRRLADAMDRDEFQLHYQPQVDLRSGEVIGVEALLRWNDPDRGLVRPGEFLPQLAGTELEVTLGDWVLETALTQLDRWREQGIELRMSVNLAAAQLQRSGFRDALADALARHPDTSPGWLELEVLESAAINDLDHIAGVLAGCRELGVRFALDDFGTGYSSLTYLKRLPVDCLKVDQSFVRDMLHDPEDLAIVDGVIGLARVFRREVIAEGVESERHAAFLLHLGCSLAQGYGIARPMPPEEFPAWLESWRRARRWQDIRLLTELRDDLAAVVAEHSSRRWVDALVAFVHAEPGARPPLLDPGECPFGRWHAGRGWHVYGSMEGFQAVGQAHQDLHRVGEDLVALVRAGRTGEARIRIPDLIAAQETLERTLGDLLGGLPAEADAPAVMGRGRRSS